MESDSDTDSDDCMTPNESESEFENDSGEEDEDEAADEWHSVEPDRMQMDLLIFLVPQVSTLKFQFLSQLRIPSPSS